MIGALSSVVENFVTVLPLQPDISTRNDEYAFPDDDAETIKPKKKTRTRVVKNGRSIDDSL